MTFMIPIPYRLTPISPIHIGCGEEVNWASTLIDGQNLLLIDLMKAELPTNLARKIIDISLKSTNERGLLQLQQLFRDNQAILKTAAYDAIPVRPKLLQEFKNKLGRNVQRNNKNAPIINKLDIARTAYASLTHSPYIPGSSLKGALRTAWLADKAKRQHVKPGNQGNELDEKKILGGSFATDPFRLIHIEDGMTTAENLTEAAWASNCNRESGKEKISNRVEVIRPCAYAAFSGSLRRRDLGGRPAKNHNREAQPVNAPPLRDLVNTVNNYHLKLFEEQARQWQNLKQIDRTWVEKTQRLLEEVNRQNCMLVRLGKYGTAEGKTVSDDMLRQVKVKVGKKEYKKQSHGTTFWLAGDYQAQSGFLPFGWAILEIGDYRSKVLQDYCETLGKKAPGTPSAMPKDPVPKDPQKALQWLKAKLGPATRNKEAQADLVIQVISSAGSWPIDDRYELSDLLADYNFGKFHQDIDDLLEEICEE
ncbi:type III-A CRISPR-associated RAMP protein Csm5 [Luteithermobacter gelatinilyticus]|uniref:type III-A CRISPR-associated RAMP protein Csm5 n=1 Tax=Luteithermobacter gelatinilyticus TaxID=2582913 RepID=UPI0011066A87|nr:type III-A CRISPR-associated RAMP protein Csm5 [Luteithermobacter gelatinilyticus]